MHEHIVVLYLLYQKHFCLDLHTSVAKSQYNIVHLCV